MASFVTEPGLQREGDEDEYPKRPVSKSFNSLYPHSLKLQLQLYLNGFTGVDFYSVMASKPKFLLLIERVGSFTKLNIIYILKENDVVAAYSTRK